MIKLISEIASYPGIKIEIMINKKTLKYEFIITDIFIFELI